MRRKLISLTRQMIRDKYFLLEIKEDCKENRYFKDMIPNKREMLLALLI